MWQETCCFCHDIFLDLGNSTSLVIWYLNLGSSSICSILKRGKEDKILLGELYKNHIQGTIPVELGNLRSLISLDLYSNNISGTIPASLGKLKSLVFLRLNDNQLTGQIPRELVGISSLKIVDVSSNNLCGTIPTTGPFEHIPLNKYALIYLSSTL
ncbi:Leucine-rich repeat protein 1 [Vitis vinifera]|uniref:Leucine-rich repeat protein 1 n=1 Tax=Vitis vinifera TaxID=29760 RepID=A0A438CRE8_VITVI|nr:Leucine-rich repeat protein 1 [Vitis vinifera]